MNMSLLAVITDNRFGDSDIERAVLEKAGIELRVAKCRSSAEVAAAGREADALLVNAAPADAAAIEALERCRVIARYGIGLDNVDVETAARRGIVVRNVPGYCDIEAAEHAVGLLISCARGIPLRDRSVRNGLWNVAAQGRRISGTVLGVVGFGGIGKAFVRACLGLGFREMLVWSPHISEERIEAAVGPAAATLGVKVRPVPFPELLSLSDWISIHIPLKPETRGLLGSRELALMKPDATLINVSRGAIVDEEALVEALLKGKLGGAGLDVFTAEPLPQGSRLRGAPGVVMTDHSAYSSRESLAELRRRTAENALAALRDFGLC
jgi:D-3-phosphoglycerate dehydrogenase / 2-oxoglutarate reductase